VWIRLSRHCICCPIIFVLNSDWLVFDIQCMRVCLNLLLCHYHQMVGVPMLNQMSGSRCTCTNNHTNTHLQWWDRWTENTIYLDVYMIFWRIQLSSTSTIHRVLNKTVYWINLETFKEIFRISVNSCREMPCIWQNANVIWGSFKVTIHQENLGCCPGSAMLLTVTSLSFSGSGHRAESTAGHGSKQKQLFCFMGK